MAASPLLRSSGDPALDRRLDWARAYLADDAAAAEGMLADLVAAAPHFSAAWFLLGEARETLGDVAGAADAYEAVLRLDATDALGAALRLARLGRRAADGAMSEAFVRTLFDQYAPRFDAALREGLGYRGPEILAAALMASVPAGRRFGRAIDLGCGTGLAAPHVAPVCDMLIGVDLSPEMVARARKTGLYAELAVAEMGAYLAAAPEAGADLILAADAFCYLADLAPVVGAARRALRPDGRLAFTVETHAGEGLLLRDTLRFAHGAPLVAGTLHAAGFAVDRLAPATTRTEKGAAVAGLVCVARPV
ncbi:class I SAM-dependent DNA methyltransferase [Aquabacter spiritensis]|uniref:Putative TPR repeat methyltransferase n=1 Tax=Aquabacter spiritensis TaxID=933073 RepID=A0A4R3M1E3_9HYPH|nr:methyltransferase domain-containing protein [Aquabacter spiritensis]TCT06812.1 putative TPR repeat methyltransferase [Aquabacter spiritensis]